MSTRFCTKGDGFKFLAKFAILPQNANSQSFNGRFRDECLNEHWFSDIVHARKTINDWRQDYNECRPHSSLNYQTPAEFAAGWRNGKYEEKPTDITN
ncbi:integrase-like protein [Raoultella planticola]|mgnify:FL=1|nr:integrase-like protein [Raoultella planticola]TDX32685.1 integrase-like protein [Raoultella planticola]